MRFFQRCFELRFALPTTAAARSTASTTTEHLFKDVEAAGSGSGRTKATEIKIVEVETTGACSSAARRSSRAFITTISGRRARSGPRLNGAPVLTILIVKFSIHPDLNPGDKTAEEQFK